MESYQSLHVWQRAHALAIGALRETEAARQPRTWAVFDQLRRAAVSVEANIVEGYALRAPRQFRRHLRIALGSAAETECLLRNAGELDYLPQEVVRRLLSLSNSTIGMLLGLLRRPMAAAEEVSGARLSVSSSLALHIARRRVPARDRLIHPVRDRPACRTLCRLRRLVLVAAGRGRAVRASLKVHTDVALRVRPRGGHIEEERDDDGDDRERNQGRALHTAFSRVSAEGGSAREFAPEAGGE